MLASIEEERIGEVSVEHAFDYDGCLGDYRDEEMPEEIAAADSAFWQELKEEIHGETAGLPGDRRCISIATARQCFGVDRLGMERDDSPSCFSLYQEIAELLDVRLDTFLLSDVRGGLPAGTSFARIMDESYQGVHETWYYDTSKITMIYAKAHRAAVANAEGLALLTFYDDRPDILDCLETFFTQNLKLLPDNLILRLCQYRRGQGILWESDNILGTGDIDKRYFNTVQIVGQHIWDKMTESGREFVVSDVSNLRLEYLFNRLRDPKLGQAYGLFERVARIVAEEVAAEDEPVIEVRRNSI